MGEVSSENLASMGCFTSAARRGGYRYTGMSHGTGGMGLFGTREARGGSWERMFCLREDGTREHNSITW